MRRCTVSGKRKYRSAVDAHVHASTFAARMMRVYKCDDCHYFHLTSSPARVEKEGVRP